MKKELLELRSVVKNSPVSELPKIRLESLFYINYYSLMDASIIGDTENIKKNITLIMVYYMSFNIVNYENSLNFVKNYYESYMLYDMDIILLSLFDPDSLFYDDSIESKVGGSLAIYEMLTADNAHKDIFSEIIKSLQKA